MQPVLCREAKFRTSPPGQLAVQRRAGAVARRYGRL